MLASQRQVSPSTHRPALNAQTPSLQAGDEERLALVAVHLRAAPTHKRRSQEHNGHPKVAAIRPRAGHGAMKTSPRQSARAAALTSAP